jgi:hypothetical protein
MSKTKASRVKRPTKDAMETWRKLMAQITRMSEKELHEALRSEVSRPREDRRDDVIIRLHRKFTRIRKERELREYLA